MSHAFSRRDPLARPASLLRCLWRGTVATVIVTVGAALCFAARLPAPAQAADLILNEYNAVDGNRDLEDDSADVFWGRRGGNGGDWFELVVVTDHLDVRGWEMVVVDDSADPLNSESFSLILSDEEIWSDLRSGTIVTIAEGLGNNVGDYEPAAGRWWINVRAGGDSSGRFVDARCVSPACDPSSVNWKVSNSDWQITVNDDAGRVVFGPAGEGISPASGVGSTEVVKLEQDPGPQITELSNYQDGSSSTFGQPNSYDQGQSRQDFTTLRSVVPYSELVSVRVNEIFSHSDPGVDWVELYNPTASPVNIGGWFLSDTFSNLTRFEIPAGTTIAAGGFLVFDENELGFGLSSPCGDELIVSAGNGSTPTGPRDFAEFGPVENSVSFGRTPDGVGPIVRLAVPTRGSANSALLAAPVVINELMYNPPPASPGVHVDAEYVEIHNPLDSPVELFTSFGLDGTFAWRLRGGIDFDFPLPTTLAARGYMLVVAFDPVARPDLLAEFRDLYNLDNAVPVLGAYSGGLNNFSDVVRLQKPDTPEPDGDICGGSGNSSPLIPRVVIDEVEYVDFEPWPPEADGDGASLERIDTGSFANDPSAWIGDPIGGPTPGRRNSSSPSTTLPEPECSSDAECDDANPCTTDTCDGIAQCRNVNADIACDDGLPCTANDRCTSGVCSGAPPCDTVCSHCDGATCASLCGVPVTRGASPLVSDALFTLQASVGIATCPPCHCDVDAGGSITATDAFRVLRAAVGLAVELVCS